MSIIQERIQTYCEFSLGVFPPRTHGTVIADWKKRNINKFLNYRFIKEQIFCNSNFTRTTLSRTSEMTELRQGVQVQEFVLDLSK